MAAELQYYSAWQPTHNKHQRLLKTGWVFLLEYHIPETV